MAVELASPWVCGRRGPLIAPASLRHAHSYQNVALAQLLSQSLGCESVLRGEGTRPPITCTSLSRIFFGRIASQVCINPDS